jgi:hypothetical protein
MIKICLNKNLLKPWVNLDSTNKGKILVKLEKMDEP